jgi:hypothetical protein
MLLCPWPFSMSGGRERASGSWRRDEEVAEAQRRSADLAIPLTVAMLALSLWDQPRGAWSRGVPDAQSMFAVVVDCGANRHLCSAKEGSCCQLAAPAKP